MVFLDYNRIKMYYEGNRTVTRIISQGELPVSNEGCTMEKIKEISTYLTEEEKAQLETSKIMPIVFDEDCPETTPDRAIKFRRVNPPRRSVGDGLS